MGEKLIRCSIFYRKAQENIWHLRTKKTETTPQINIPGLPAWKKYGCHRKSYMVIYENMKVIESFIEVYGNMQVIKRP